MINYDFVTQPEAGVEYRSLLETAYGTAPYTHLDVAVAYTTFTGIGSLKELTSRPTFTDWDTIKKRWLISIDWYRSQPVAINALASLPNSSVRVHDGAFVVGRPGCTPRTSFHTKAFLLRRQKAKSLFCGSGNLSQNGFEVAHEWGSLVTAIAPFTAGERKVWQKLEQVEHWYQNLWRRSTPWSSIKAAYTRQYSANAVRAPIITEDDSANTRHLGQRGITPERLRQLRAATNLWIEAGNLHENFGPGRPGNQLMMTRMTRVFFGFPAEDVPENTTVGQVSIRFGAAAPGTFSLRFSDNSMDVLNLPHPGGPGPTKYDQETLLFTREKSGVYGLRLVRASELAGIKQQSIRAEGHVRMTSGREWGVF